ncbi:chemotaxis protein CheB [Anaeromyxobacter oryzae]|uniref:protein-glutamate methylesterase n=1 Tax=Anaeromyxobacter oryzae TaxID=2918170 RepID=A0ABM7X114_9BACT|nr:chemotaxis protein CheB [Anaeromyxobacter oryzae]BDG05487.1 chemotaxis protein CheB [Anaeromyxobacter oryzae]
MIATVETSLAPAAPAVVVIGGSAGALEPLRELLHAFPAGYPVPVVVVLHLPRTGPSALADVLGAGCRLAVREAVDKAPLAPGVVHVAPPGYHVLVEAGPALALSVDDPVHFSIPSIDVLFESAAATCGPRVAGVVLSGASADGAAGLAAIESAGGVVAVQAPAGAALPTMPAAALARCPCAAALPVAELSALLVALAPAGAGRDA